MTKYPTLSLHPDRLFPADAGTRAIARDLYQHVKDLPIISPHGHTDPRWFADNQNFTDAVELLLWPDHYVLRMLFSQGISFEALGIAASPVRQDVALQQDRREIWRLFAGNYHLFLGTPSRMWLDHVFAEVFALDKALNKDTADLHFDQINEQLQQSSFKPRALFEKFNMEFLATTESALDDLAFHRRIQQSDWSGRVVTTYRPDSVVDPEFEGFAENLEEFGRLSSCDVSTWKGYLEAHRNRRVFFQAHGATATDHGHPTARTADLSYQEASQLYQRVLGGHCTASEAELFRAQMLTEMAKMSLEDGLVMQLHPGCHRNHNMQLFQRYGRDRGADIPVATEYVQALKPLLNRVGNEPAFTFIVFTLDETSYSRELAPLAGHYPAMRVGPAWWFHDSPEGMRRYREQMTETAGFFNTVGFNDDTRAFLSIPARHDVARRMDCSWLAQLVAEHRMGESEAADLIWHLSYGLAKKAYRV